MENKETASLSCTQIAFIVNKLLYNLNDHQWCHQAEAHWGSVAHSKKRLCCFDPKFVVLGTVEMCKDTSVSWLRILAFP